MFHRFFQLIVLASWPKTVLGHTNHHQAAVFSKKLQKNNTVQQTYTVTEKLVNMEEHLAEYFPQQLVETKKLDV